MTFKSILKKLTVRACVNFSLIMLVYIIIAAAVNVGGGDLLLDAARVILFFVFASLWAIANAIYRSEIAMGAVRLLIHFILMLFAFYTCLILPLGTLKPSVMIVGFVLFGICYFAFMGISAAISAKYRANKEASEQYASQFKK